MGITTTHATIMSSLNQFLSGLDKCPSTIKAYRTDMQQFIAWLHAHDITVICAHHVTNNHINDYLRYLADQGLTGTTCARKLVSIHLFFTYLVSEGVIPSSPDAKVKKPPKKCKPKHVLRFDEFQRILRAARGHPRDFALLQLLLHAGIRVSEVISIHLSELDLEHKMLTIHGKGGGERMIPLEQKVLNALQSYLEARSMTDNQYLFLNYQGQGLSIGGVRKMVEKYARCAGIPKKITCHSLFYTCSTHSSVLGMIDFSPKTPFSNERMRTPKKDMPLGKEELQKLMEYTSL